MNLKPLAYLNGQFQEVSGTDALAINALYAPTAIDIYIGGTSRLRATSAGVGVNGTLTVGATGVNGRLDLARASDGLAVGSIYVSNNQLLVDNAAGQVEVLPGSVFTTAFPVGGGISVRATDKIRFDGIDSLGDTYLVESSANVLDAYVGGANVLRLNSAGATVTSGSNYIVLNAGTVPYLGMFYAGAGDFRFYGLDAAVTIGAKSVSNGLKLTLGGSSTYTGLVANQLGAVGGMIGVTATGADAVMHIGAPSGYAGYLSLRETGVGERGAIGFAAGSADLQFRLGGATSMATGAEVMRLISSGGHLAIGATSRLYLDGTAGTGDTYLVESSTNIISAYTGGVRSLYLGGANTSAGWAALYANTTGNGITASGYQAAYANTTGNYITVSGYQAAYANTTGNYITAFGAATLFSNTTGNYNTTFGMYGLYNVTIGNNNTSIGYYTGIGITTGSNNTILGAGVAGLDAALTDNIILATGQGTIRAQFDGINWTLNGGLVLPKTSGVGIKIDTAAPVFGWHDLTGALHARTTGVAVPSFVAYAGTSLYQYQFSNAQTQELFVEFHIPHDYVPGSDVFLHTHWSQTTADAGTACKWSFDVLYAKGHQQQAFPSSVTTVSVTQNASSTVREHMIAETQLSTSGSIGGNALEVDGVILVRVWRDAADAADTLTQAPFLHFCDLHYQSTALPTKGKAPNFYS